MIKKEKLARFALASLKGMSPVKFKQAVDTYNNVSKFCNEFKVPITKLTDSQIKDLLVYGEEQYPKLLMEIPDPPPFIYKTGEMAAIPEKCVAIVGTRNITSYGVQVAKEITRQQVSLGYCIVSGMAGGVDTVVHKACLEAGGKTIAVLGGNVYQPYPASNSELYKKIKTSGCVISEFNSNIGYAKFMFARRNRIIAGLAQKIIVVEAPEKSGAMITAKYAREYNRELIAVPGGIYQKMSSGCNHLIYQNEAQIYIKQSCKIDEMITDATDKLIIQTISEGNSSLDEILEKVYMTRAQLINRLINLEMQEIIAKDLFDRYIVLS